MLTFNDILAIERIDPRGVVLVRHQVRGRPGAPTPYGLWRRRDPRLEEYQRIQGQKRFSPSDTLASFVVTPRDETLYIGLYSVVAIGRVPEGILDPIGGHSVAGLYYYDISRDNRLADYAGKLIVEWGAGYRQWAQRAHRNQKRVLEIRSQEVADEPWPGFGAFSWLVAEADLIPPNWQPILQAVRGVYLLVDTERGQQYVGSATGTENLWGRLMDYARTGHGNNVELKRLGPRPYQFSVLQALTSDDEDILQAEAAWKKKLLSRKFGLNEN